MCLPSRRTYTVDETTEMDTIRHFYVKNIA